MHSTDAVANFFIEKATEKEQPLSPMKLQKLVFFAHGWHFAVRGGPLVSEPVQVWPWGPVFSTLYHEFKEFGRNPITRKARNLQRKNDGSLQLVEPQIEDPTGELRPFLERVWELYGRYTAIQLSNLTHAPGTPWRQVADLYPPDEYPDGIPQGLTIPEPVLEAYFKSLLAPAPSIPVTA